MDYKKLKSAAETITMPEDVKHRIVRNLSSRKERTMNTKNHTFLRKPAAVLITAALCIALSVSAVAASGVLKGYFRDITNWQGAVVGTSYEQATDEIDMNITVNGNDLTVLATFAIPQEFPYREIENLGIAAYRIVDANGKAVKEGTAESAEVVGGQAAMGIGLDDIDCGCYKLIVTAFVAGKKAEQPLNINGSWECVFSK